MPNVIFTHPEVRNGSPLVITTGADSIRWSYSLNTANWPTYGGEVVQILSVAINDVEIMGTCRSYAQMESIYKYFLEFVQIASQGRGNATPGVTAYNQQPMRMQYPERGWTMKVIPRSLPGFRKARDVVAPEYHIGAYMVDDSEDINELKDLVHAGVNLFGEDFELTGQIGYIAENPWSDPMADIGKDAQGKVNGQVVNTNFDPAKTRKMWDQVGDYYNKVIPSWLDGDFDSITKQFGSSPAFLHWGDPQTDQGGSDSSGGGKDVGGSTQVTTHDINPNG